MKNNIQIYARAFNRETGQPISETRSEEIDISENELFEQCKTILEVKNAYESYWNELNPNSKEVVFVQEIVAY